MRKKFSWKEFLANKSHAKTAEINAKNCSKYCRSQKLIKRDQNSLAKTYSQLKTQNFVLLGEHGRSFTILLGFYRFKDSTILAILGEKEYNGC